MIRILENLKTITNKEIRAVLPGVEIVKEGVKGVKGVILDARPFDIVQWPTLKVISRVGVGVDNIDLEECRERGIAVFTTPCQELTDAVAQFTVRQILNLLTMDASRSRNLSEMRVGIVGCGRIGSAVAKLLCAFGAQVRAYDISPFLQDATKDSLLKWADIVTVHVSGNREVIGERELGSMRPGGYLINMARGECVNEAQVVSALQTGKLAGFVSDVNYGMVVKGVVSRRVLLTPHIASDTLEARAAMERKALENLVKGLGGKR